MTVEYNDLSEGARRRLVEEVRDELSTYPTRRRVLQAGGIGLAALFGAGAGDIAVRDVRATSTGRVAITDFDIYQNEDGQLVIENDTGATWYFGPDGSMAVSSLAPAESPHVSTPTSDIITGATTTTDPGETSVRLVEYETNTTGFRSSAGDIEGANLSRGAVWQAGTLFYDQETMTWSNTNTTIRSINVQPFDHPPELIPIVYLDAELRNRASGEAARLHVYTKKDRGSPLQIKVGVTGNAWRRVYKEVYLADFLNHYNTGEKKQLPTIKLTGELTGGIGEARQVRIGMKYEVR